MFYEISLNDLVKEVNGKIIENKGNNIIFINSNYINYKDIQNILINNYNLISKISLKNSKSEFEKECINFYTFKYDDINDTNDSYDALLNLIQSIKRGKKGIKFDTNRFGTLIILYCNLNYEDDYYEDILLEKKIENCSVIETIKK